MTEIDPLGHASASQTLKDFLGRRRGPRRRRARVGRRRGSARRAASRRGPLAGELGAAVGANTDGDIQKALDLFADAAFAAALKRASVRALASEEREVPDRPQPRRQISRRDRSARRLLQHRRQRHDRYDLLRADGAERSAGDVDRFLAARTPPARGGHVRLRPAHGPGLHARRGNPCGGARPAKRATSDHPRRTSTSPRASRNSRSTRRMRAIGRRRCAPMSTIA